MFKVEDSDTHNSLHDLTDERTKAECKKYIICVFIYTRQLHKNISVIHTYCYKCKLVSFEIARHCDFRPPTPHQSFTA